MKFELGMVVTTPGAQDAMLAADTNPLALLSRHATGDWGDLDPDDAQMNDDALTHGDRVLSSYQLTPDTKVWIITESDRSSTTFLLPEDY